MSQGTVVPLGAEASGGFDALRILDDEFTVTIGGEEHTFETPRDEDGRIIFVNGNGKNREITYGRDIGTAWVTYNKNGGEGQIPQSQSFRSGQPVTLAALAHPRELCKLDSTFDGWSTDQSGAGTMYSPGETTSFDSNTILYAIFTDVFK